ncbi:MAG: pilin [Woeseiaceae bacterium]|nr:pilin [Woeseiaceae bacterium]
MNRRARHYAHLAAATDLSQSLRSTLEFGAGVAALMLVTVFAANSIQHAVVRSQTAEVFAMASTVKVDIVAHRAVHGEWPADANELANASLMEPFESGMYVDRFQLGEGGAFTATFDVDNSSEAIQGRQLTFRPTSLSGSPNTPVVWVCAQHRLVEGFEPSGVDQTDIEPINLPSVCREH